MRARGLGLLAGGTAAAVIGLGAAAGTAAASGPYPEPDPVVTQPNPVTPGGQITVYDGGNCRGVSGRAVFRTGDTGTDIPSVDLGPLSGQVGGSGTVPARTEPGGYRVSVVCDDGRGDVEGPFTGVLYVVPGHHGWDDDGGHGRGGDGDHGRGGDGDWEGGHHRHPHGATHAGAGGTAAGADARDAALGLALLTAACAGTVLLRRARAGRAG